MTRPTHYSSREIGRGNSALSATPQTGWSALSVWSSASLVAGVMLLTILIILLILALLGGGWGYGRYGYVSLSPLAIIIIILLVLWLTGSLTV